MYTNSQDPAESGGIRVELSEDEITASVVFHLQERELRAENRQNLIRQCLEALGAANISFGIDLSALKGEIANGTPYPVAKGVLPVNGSDSVINMYTIEESKPRVLDDGSVNFYELKLINRVSAGDWLGERIEATEGFEGMTVTGKVLKPVKGRQYPLNYDRNSVREEYEETKTVLYSRISGAVNYDQGRIGVSQHLEIAGDVDLSTGNINFDGFVTIKGTVCDGFSVVATKDIEVNGQLGLGNIREITSSGGSVFIRGGISSKGRSEIKAAKNVFVKFVDNTHITSGGATHVGYYCINSEVRAKELFMDSLNGQIIGGNITAEVKVFSPIIGSPIEKKTVIEVLGFSRAEMTRQLDDVFHNISEMKKRQQFLKQQLNSLDSSNPKSPYQRKQYLDICEEIYNVREQIKSAEEDRKNLIGYLKARGDGEITASKRIYPNCVLILKGKRLEINSPVMAATYYVQEGMVKQA